MKYDGSNCNGDTKINVLFVDERTTGNAQLKHLQTVFVGVQLSMHHALPFYNQVL